MIQEKSQQAHQLRGLLQELARATQRLEKIEGGCCGLTSPQCQLLLEINRRRDATQGELALALGVDASTLSRVSEGLIQHELLARTPHPSDRRKSILTLTKSGKALAQGIDQGLVRFTQALLERIPPERRNGLLESLELLSDTIRTLGAEPFGKSTKPAHCCPVRED